MTKSTRFFHNFSDRDAYFEIKALKKPFKLCELFSKDAVDGPWKMSVHLTAAEAGKTAKTCVDAYLRTLKSSTTKLETGASEVLSAHVTDHRKALALKAKAAVQQKAEELKKKRLIEIK